MAVTALATAMDTDMERGQLTLMPMPTMAMVDTALAMEATAMAAMVDTATARGPLMPMAATAMVATDTAMATATARGPLRPSSTTAMAATATVDTDTESKKSKSISCNNTKNPTPNYLKLTYLNGQENYGCVSFKQRQRV